MAQWPESSLGARHGEDLLRHGSSLSGFPPCARGRCLGQPFSYRLRSGVFEHRLPDLHPRVLDHRRERCDRRRRLAKHCRYHRQRCRQCALVLLLPVWGNLQRDERMCRHPGLSQMRGPNRGHHHHERRHGLRHHGGRVLRRAGPRNYRRESSILNHPRPHHDHRRCE